VNVPHFEVDEHQEEGRLRLTLSGELDLAAVPVLEERLEQLRSDRGTVRLDLSKLEFMDSAGLHLLLRWTNDARENGWTLEIDRDVSQVVKRLFELVGVECLLASEDSN
jgi:anti-sigma B factor antagonist